MNEEKVLYLVRHGESEENAAGVFQGPDARLSPRGARQAEILAERFRSIPVDTVFSSPLLRARATAEAIAGRIGAAVEIDGALEEKRKPSAILGKRKDEAAEIVEEMRRHEEDPEWRCEDGENLADVYARASAFVSRAEKHSHARLLAVTHGTAMRMIIARLMADGPHAPMPLVCAVQRFLWIQNTGITACIRDGEGRWRLKVWNDHAHLGEYGWEGGKEEEDGV